MTTTASAPSPVPAWRTEPEISGQRQQELARLLAIPPDIQKGIYPFKGKRLARADVEWLLATHEQGRGPVDWQDEGQRERAGLDLRGADLSGVDLTNLPLARLIGGLDEVGGRAITTQQRLAAAIDLCGANLRGACLDGAILYNAGLRDASLQGASLREARLRWARLERANLREADLRGANLSKAHLEGANLSRTWVAGLRLDGAYFSSESNVQLGYEAGAPVFLADVRWDKAQVMAVDWSKVDLGEERVARRSRSVADYEVAIRTCRQLALLLQGQGMSDDANEWNYRAQTLRRSLLRKQRAWGNWLLSWVLAASSGYGYRPLRCLVVYAATVVVFTLLHWALALFLHSPIPLWYALGVSVQDLHGRIFSFSSGGETLLNTIEAFAGLFVEALVIGVFMQRILGGQS